MRYACITPSRASHAGAPHSRAAHRFSCFWAPRSGRSPCQFVEACCVRRSPSRARHAGNAHGSAALCCSCVCASCGGRYRCRSGGYSRCVTAGRVCPPRSCLWTSLDSDMGLPYRV